jgi:hypothetical protein
MTNEWIINQMQMFFGGNTFPNAPRSPRHKPQWQWILSGRKAVVMIEAILPYLKLKRTQAELVIRFQKAKSLRMCRHRTPEEYAYEVECVSQMRKLNQRGIPDEV